MKIYVVTTGIMFAIITLLHILRMMEETRLITDPFYIVATAIAAALAVWAALVVRSSKA